MQAYVGDVRVIKSVAVQDPADPSYNTGVAYETCITGISDTVTVS